MAATSRCEVSTELDDKLSIAVAVGLALSLLHGVLFLQCGVYEVVEFKSLALKPLHEVRVSRLLRVSRRQEGSHAARLPPRVARPVRGTAH